MSPQQVFNYILANKGTYNMDGIKMEPLVLDSDSETDHILVQGNTCTFILVSSNSLVIGHGSKYFSVKLSIDMS